MAIIAVFAIPLFILLAMIVGFGVPYFGIKIFNFLFGTSVVFAVWMHWVCMIGFIAGIFYIVFKLMGNHDNNQT